MARWPLFIYGDVDSSVFRLELVLTSCKINKTKMFQDCMLKTSSGCSALPDR